MRITLDVPDDVAGSADRLAKEKGSTRESLLTDALRASFPPMSAGFREELGQWEAAATADAAKLGL